jgi:hypothetical protein
LQGNGEWLAYVGAGVLDDYGEVGGVGDGDEVIKGGFFAQRHRSRRNHHDALRTQVGGRAGVADGEACRFRTTTQYRQGATLSRHARHHRGELVTLVFV